MKKLRNYLAAGLIVTSVISCNTENSNSTPNNTEQKLNNYKTVTLTSDLSELTENEKKMLPFLFEAATIMDEIFWTQAYGKQDSLLSALEDSALRAYVKINYGPWDRLNGNEPFIEGIGPKPLGANFYPEDMDEEEFKKFDAKNKESLYTLIRRNDEGELVTLPYHEAFKEKNEKAVELIKKAAALAEDEGLKNYLELRAEALLTDDYLASDMAWMDMKTNTIDFVVGPIENYEDRLYGYKAAHEAFILIKDQEWSQRLLKYAEMLPELQKGLPVDDIYKKEKPGTNSDLGAYDVIFYAGDCNAGSKTIAINLPNDERVQLEKGSRRLQLKNAMRAKFDQILMPISEVLIAEDQRQYISFDAFFENTMFHEVAHGLGIKNTVTDNQPVRQVLKEQYSAIEEGKADILGLYMVTKLNEQGELTGDLMDNYVTFMASIFRSIRFGASSAHGKANLMRYNYFKDREAFTKNEDGTYSINFQNMQNAMNELSGLILTMQGNGDYEGVKNLMQRESVMDDELKEDLERLKTEAIPVDIVFKQGADVVGIEMQ